MSNEITTDTVTLRSTHMMAMTYGGQTRDGYRVSVDYTTRDSTLNVWFFGTKVATSSVSHTRALIDGRERVDVPELERIANDFIADHRAKRGRRQSAGQPEPKLYRLTLRSTYHEPGRYGSAVVVALDEDTAARIHPGTGRLYDLGPCACCGLTDPSNGGWRDGKWAPSPADVMVTLIGLAAPGLACPSVVLSSTIV